MENKIFKVETKDIFTVGEAADYLTVSRDFVYALIKSGKLAAIKFGSRYKIKAEAIIKYIDSNREK